jgi:hypothetical protein
VYVGWRSKLQSKWWIPSKIMLSCRILCSLSGGYEEYCLLVYITQCCPLKVNGYFGGTCRLHLQGQRVSRTRNQHKSRRSSAYHLFSRWFLVRLTLWPWRWRCHVPLKRLLTFNGLHGFISQKTELVILSSLCHLLIWRRMMMSFPWSITRSFHFLKRLQNYKLYEAFVISWEVSD